MVLMSAECAGGGDIEITRAQNRNFPLGEEFRPMVGKSNTGNCSCAMKEFKRRQASLRSHRRTHFVTANSMKTNLRAPERTHFFLPAAYPASHFALLPSQEPTALPDAILSPVLVTMKLQ
jgi:hypothetical protein